MTDFATLALEIDSTGVKTGVNELDKLTAAGARAEGAVDRLGDSAEQTGAQMRGAGRGAAEMAREAQEAAKRATEIGGTSKLASHHVQNLAFQFQDLGLQLTAAAQSSKPFQGAMMALFQQGTQISGVMSQAGLSVGGLVKQIGTMAAPFLPVIAAVGALGIGVAALTEEVNDNTKVSVSWQNTMLGAFDVVKEYLSKQLTAAFAAFGTSTGQVWETVKAYTKNAINFMIGASMAVPRLIADTYKLIGPAIGDAFYSGVNLAIEGLNLLISKSAGAVNGLVDIFNDVFGTSIPKAATDGIAKIQNPYAGAMAQLGSVGAKSLVGSFKRDYVGDIADAITGAAVKRQLAENAEKAGKETGKKLAKATKKAAEDEIDNLFKGFKPIKLDTDGAYEQMIEDIARARQGMADLQKAQEALEARQLAEFNDELERLRDLAGEIDFGSMFGGAGDALNGMLSVLDRLSKAQTDYSELMKKAGTDEAKRREVQAAYDKAKLNGTVALLGQTKTLFKEQSAGYKMVEAAEKASAALAAVNTIKHVAAGAAKIFAQLGPWAFPVVGAMVAVMAGLGFSGGGGSTGYVPPTAEDMQASIGTGTVLGDSSAQSESIANALQIMAENSNSDLEYSNDMVKYLRNISDGIGNLTAQIARQVGLGGGGMFSTGNLNLGTTGSNGVLGLFGSSTTRSLYDQGIQLFNFKIGEVLQQGVQAQVYNVVEQVKKSSGFLGIGGGTKTTYQTITGTVSQQIKDQFGLIVNDVAESVVAFVTEIGKQTSLANVVNIEQQARDYINSLTLPGATLSFKDMSGDEIEKALNAYFSSVADQIAMMTAGLVGLSDLSQFQKAGEGLYETLSRITRTFMTVNTTLKSVGADQITAVGGNSSAQAVFPVIQNLVDQFGGLDAFQEAVSNFGDTFLTEAERMAPIIDSVRAEMARLGQSGITTNDQFKQLVWSLDLSTESGQAMFAQLMSVAPAFAKTTEYLASLNGEVQETGKTAAQLAAIEKDRRALQIQIMELQGDAEGALAAKRADALAALDASLRPLQEQVWVLQDQAAAAETAKAAAEALAATEARIAQERTNLEQQLLQLQGNTAALRERELAALDPANRALMQQIYALQDQAAATEAAAQAAANLAAEQERVAQEREGLEGQLLQLLGDTAAIRQRELAALDPSNRALMERIYALQDEQAALQAATILANSRRALEIQLMEATGDAAGALAAKRADELAAMDASLQALQQQVWAAQDAAAAAAKAQAEADAARQKAEQAREEALRRAEELAKARGNLQIELLEAQGRSAEALALRRQMELAAMDASLRGLQQQVWAAQDAAAARDKLTDSYRDMISEWQASVDTFGGLADDLRAYRKKLTDPDGNTAAGYASNRTEFQRLAALAAGGDKTAMQGLQGAGDAFLASAMANASSVVQYQRDLSMVLQGLDKSIFAADTTADYAQVQIDALNRQIELLEGIAQNTAVTATPAVPSAPTTVTTSAGTVSAANSLEAEVKALRQDLNAALLAIKQDTGKTARTLERVTDNDRLRVGNDADSPVYTSAVP